LGGASAIASVPLIRVFGEAGLRPGPSFVVLLATVGFFVPSALLSAVTPLTVKIQLDSLHATGRVVGELSALGTAGSLVGVFSTGFLLIAAFPTTPVIITVGALLVAAGVALWVRLGRLLPAALVATGVGVAASSSALALVADGPCQVETTYFCARVEHDLSRPSGRILWLDTLQHSYVDVDDPTYLGHSYAQTMGDVVDTMAPPGAPLDAVHVGGGGFTLPRYLDAIRPGTRSVVLELDPSIVELAEDELGLVLDADLRAVTGDARNRLREVPTDSADLVIGDAFGGRSVPWHLTTREFLHDVDRVLRPDGTYVVNLIDQVPLGFARAEVATLRDVWEHVAIVGPPERVAGERGGNFILVARHQPIDAAAIEAASRARGDPETALTDPAALDRFVGGADVLTDEHAPVDQLLRGGP
jgi:spermidine synthase